MIRKRSLTVLGTAMTGMAVAAWKVYHPKVVLTWPLYQEDQDLTWGPAPSAAAVVSPSQQATHELLVGW